MLLFDVARQHGNRQYRGQWQPQNVEHMNPYYLRAHVNFAFRKKFE